MNLFRTLRYQHYQTYDPAIPSLKVKSPFKNIFSYFKDNPLLCIFAGLFLIGMLAGIVLLYHADGQLREWLHILLGGYLEKRYEQSFSQIAALSFGSSVFLLLILFFCGFCTISQPIILLLVLFRGLGYGFSMGGLYAEKGTLAAPFVFSTLFLPMLFGSILLICAAKTSFLLSLRLLRKAITPSEHDERVRMRRYCIRYFLYLIICILIALLDAVLSIQFAAFFPVS
ncbi:hypothetical protein D7Y09_01990 [bacterium 1XD42-1]|nr:hypothetical protein [Oscillospiraceae bacterium]RKJ58288.1 hypothetical protein D7X25_02720 [bacterium 1XD42-8]RKJ66879.1 hypothetical protein D7Y09_01990 [bacterium 1XD42-1]